jgi:hypothetical protein
VAVEVRLEEVAEHDLLGVEYRWDADTDILSASLRTNGVSEGLTGSIDSEGADGAWLMLEVMAGRLRAVEVAVWPDVRTIASLVAPAPVGFASLQVPSRSAHVGEDALEVDTPIRAVADEEERTIHFRIGPVRPSRALLVAKDLLVEVDAHSKLAGLWLLNVPPFPQSSVS